jgi:farnesyl-diphosphate farnesyltransferase
METNRQRIGQDEPQLSARIDPADNDDERFQEEILHGVSRTFALTIPELPDRLRRPVTTGYLLCRIADTIEDDRGLEADLKDRYLEAFLEALETGRGAEEFARGLHLRLSARTPADERVLVRGFPRVLRVTHSLPSADRKALLECVSTMSRGMGEYERNRSRCGLADVRDLERYCYYVAGVVGEMLTKLFCNYSPDIEARRPLLETHAVDFGLGLQMTNILMDIWDDIDRGTCWLPREVFQRHGYDLDRLAPGHRGNIDAFMGGMDELIGLAHEKLRSALAYTLLIPRHETGIRRFLAWALLLAVLSLRKVHEKPDFDARTEVKVSRRSLRSALMVSSAMIRSNAALRALFLRTARGLPTGQKSHRPRVVAT